MLVYADSYHRSNPGTSLQHDHFAPEAAANHIDIRNGWEREEWRNPYVPVQSLNTVVKLVQIQSVILFDVHTNAVYMVDTSYSYS